MSDAFDINGTKPRMKSKEDEGDQSEAEEAWDSDDDDETIARIQRAHYAQAAAMSQRRRPPPKPRPMSQKRKMEAVKHFHDFTKKLKKDTGIRIRSLPGSDLLDINQFSSSESDVHSDSDGLSEENFEVNPNAVEELNEENESYIDPETGDFIKGKSLLKSDPPSPTVASPPPKLEEEEQPQPKTLTISDIINEGDLDLTKNVEIAEVDESDLCPDKCEELLDIKNEDNSQDFDLTEKLKEMGEISVKPVKTDDVDTENKETEEDEKKSEGDDEKKSNPNALNVRRNIREVMDEKQLDASTLTAQRQESERLARVQEQQRIIREVQRQIALNRQNKVHQKTLSLLQGGSSLLKKSIPGQKLNLPNTVLVKLPSGEVKKQTVKPNQIEFTRVPKPSPSGSVTVQKIMKADQKTDKKEVVEIVDSSSGEESSSSSSDSDDCIMLSDSEVPPSPEAEDDPNNSGLHVNDAYNLPDEQGRVQINIGHPENEEDIFLAPQIARIIKPHQIGGVRFLFDNIIESVERFSSSSGFGCILAHSMGLGKTLQIVCFCDIFLRHTQSKTVLCIMPINTLQNWVAEFNMWLPLDPTNSPLTSHGEVRARNFPIYVLNDSHRTLQMRAKVVKDWKTTGGVLMIGYELYRLLSMKKDKKPRKKKKADAKQDLDNKDKNELKEGQDDTLGPEKQDDRLDNDIDGDKDEKKEEMPSDEDKKLLDEMYDALVRPGPDLVICDEGHRIKNSHSNISFALKQMRTKRRIVLTGYPLQNNLLEYWCMVDFVRPNYLGSKTEFCNMFERPIQNGQCIDSTPQDIRLMRYRAHVLHSLLVGFVQRRSHAVLQSTLPQKEEYVMLVRMTPLQRKLYDRFMNEVVRSTSVPNPLKAFAICCKIWNHPDVLYNFLKKRSEVSAAIEEDLDLEEIGGVTKAGRAARSKAQPKRAAKTRVYNKKGSAKKPAATIPPNTTSAPKESPQNNFPNNSYPSQPNGSTFTPPQTFKTEASDQYPPYPNYQNQNPGYYPPNASYNQNYSNNFYSQQQQQPPYGNNYPNQYPQNNPECNQGYNQNYWGNRNYYENPGYYNNQICPTNQSSQDYRGNAPPDYNNSQQYPPNYNAGSNDQNYPNNAVQPYTNNQDLYNNQPRPAFPQNSFPNQPGYSEYNLPPTPTPQYQNNQSTQNYPNQPYNNAFPPEPYAAGNYNTQYDTKPSNYSNYPSNAQPLPNQPALTPAGSTEYRSEIKPAAENNTAQVPPVAFPDPAYNYQSNPSFQNQNDGARANNYSNSYNFSNQLEVKPPLGSAGSITSWPIATSVKLESDKTKSEKFDAKTEIKSESDSEVKIEDLDTKTIIQNDIKKADIVKLQNNFTETANDINKFDIVDAKKVTKGESKTEGTESEEDGKKGKKGKNKKKNEYQRNSKPKSKSTKGRKDRKASKDCTESEVESEKEEKMKREDELALMKKAEEVTYDWATDLLKDYIAGIIENSAKMELFFFILNESIKLGDRLLLFSQSLFTLNLIEDFLEKNYIPGTDRLWERNTSYYRLDGSTHALEREKLINEFNANPNVYLFLVSTRAGSLGINLVGANRVIVFDASWNPCHDTQAVCRVYRYGQKKPCFVYRFVMDWCLEKKIYDRQINKQGMADRVVDECNPDAVLSMKEITNLCFDTDEKESAPKDLSEYKDKYLDVVMQKIITDHGCLLSKEPFQHESLLVDRKEKKLSSAEKRLAQRGYELEKKAASGPKASGSYRTVRAADGSLVQRPVASVRPMQHGARWIPADVWRRQGMTAQEMTLPLDVVIPTNSAEKTNIVLKAGQRVMVLKSPKGIYMQLESGKIIAIKTSFKGLGAKPTDNKDNNPIGKKILGNRPSPVNLPGSLKNNSAITITSKGSPRPPMHRGMNRPNIVGHNKIPRPYGAIHSFKPRSFQELKSYGALRAKAPLPQGRLLKPNLPGSVSITKIQRDPSRKADDSDSTPSLKVGDSDDDTQLLDSEDDDYPTTNDDSNSSKKFNDKPIFNDKRDVTEPQISNKIDVHSEDSKSNDGHKTKTDDNIVEPITLTTDETLPPETLLDDKAGFENSSEIQDNVREESSSPFHSMKDTLKTSKLSLLKNYRHQRSGARQLESSLTQLERTATALNSDAMPDFRKNLDDITQSYSPSSEERLVKSKKKKSPNKVEAALDINERPQQNAMSHSVSNLLGPSNAGPKPRGDPSIPPMDPVGPIYGHSLPPMAPSHHSHMIMSSNPQPIGPPNNAHSGMLSVNTSRLEGMDIKNPPVAHSLPNAGPQSYPTVSHAAPDAPYGQYPGYGYDAYPNAAPYYGGYGSAPYYPPYQYAQPAPAPAPEQFPPANPQW